MREARIARLAVQFWPSTAWIVSIECQRARLPDPADTKAAARLPKVWDFERDALWSALQTLPGFRHPLCRR